MRVLPLLFLFAVVLGGGPASADELPPPAFPSGLPSPDTVGNGTDVGQGYTPGPRMTITPGTGSLAPATGGSTPSGAATPTAGVTGASPGVSLGTAPDGSSPTTSDGAVVAPGSGNGSGTGSDGGSTGSPTAALADDGSPAWVAALAVLVIAGIVGVGLVAALAGRRRTERARRPARRAVNA